MLARLVVHLQAQYGGLTSGLKTARSQTAVAAQSIRQSVAVLDDVDRVAGGVATSFEAIAAAADGVDVAASSAAFAAEKTATSLNLASKAASTFSTSVGALDRASMVATGGLSTVATAAGAAAPTISRVSTITARTGEVLRRTAATAQTLASSARTTAFWISSATGRLLHFLHIVHAVRIIVSLLTTAFQMLAVPLRALYNGLVMVGAAFRTFAGGVLSGMLGALRAVFTMIGMVIRAIWAVVKPILSAAIALAKLWFLFKGFIGSLRIIWGWLSMLPPKFRLLAVALLGLGLAGKVGAVGLRLLSMAIGALSFVVRVGVAGVRLLSLPILALLNPAKAARVALQLMGEATAFLGRMAVRAASLVFGLAGSIAQLTRKGVGSILGLGSAILKTGLQAAAYGAAAATAWGIKLATAAETSRVVFGTMLHDMAQGKALLAQLQNSKVAPFFDAKAIQDAGRDLLKAKVPVDQITGRLEQLGSIAIATKTPIEDLSRIYRQGMAKGAFQLDSINQMAERGVDIYAALTAVTGKSGQALADMISEGKIGAAKMNAAIDHMTKGHGIYAGVVDNVAKTSAGMWSTSLNNISMALQTMFGVAVEGNKGLLASWVELTEQIKQRAMSIGPVILQLSNTITGIFRGLYDVVATVWTSIFGVTQTTYAGMLSGTMEWVTKFRWFFTNLVPIVQFVGLMMLLAMTTTLNDIAYWFTTKLPAYLEWFANNWRAVFRDLAVGTMTVFSNLATNIKGAMTAIWEFIKSGGTSSLQFTWTPLLDGFKETVSQLPDVPDRAMTALEEGMQQQIQTIGTELADSFDAMSAEAEASMAAASVVPPVVPLQSTPAGGGEQGADAAASDKGSKKENTPLLKGSAEATSAIYAAMKQKEDRKEKLQQQQLVEQKKTTTAIQHVASSLNNAPQIAVVESLG